MAQLVPVMLGGREVNLRLTFRILARIHEELGVNLLKPTTNDDEIPEHMKLMEPGRFYRAVWIMAGAEEFKFGDADWFGDNIDLDNIEIIQAALGDLMEGKAARSRGTPKRKAAPRKSKEVATTT